jgi:hypothetical protein
VVYKLSSSKYTRAETVLLADDPAILIKASNEDILNQKNKWNYVRVRNLVSCRWFSEKYQENCGNLILCWAG